jgi:hypothetical protein
VAAWAGGVFGPDYRALLERGLPGAFEQQNPRDMADALAAFFAAHPLTA